MLHIGVTHAHTTGVEPGRAGRAALGVRVVFEVGRPGTTTRRSWLRSPAQASHISVDGQRVIRKLELFSLKRAGT
jgi:hypothetical protein